VVLMHMNMNKNRHGVVPTLVFTFGGCSEGQSEDLLGAGPAGSALASQKASQGSGVRGRSWGLEEVWAQLQLLTNRHENRHGVFPMLASAFGGHSEQQLDDSLGGWLCLVKTQVKQKWSERDVLVLGRSCDSLVVAHERA
jgi:hypothetical protein